MLNKERKGRASGADGFPYDHDRMPAPKSDAEGKKKLTSVAKRADIARRARQKADAERAMLNQALRAGRDAGATIDQLANSAGLSAAQVRYVLSRGPFGREKI